MFSGVGVGVAVESDFGEVVTGELRLRVDSGLFHSGRRSFAVKDEIFCLFEGALDNLESLRQQYGLAKSANEVILVIEAYKALRGRAPYPPKPCYWPPQWKFCFHSI
ncbi:hypothetical protein COP2_012667 [Malus domestica]